MIKVNFKSRILNLIQGTKKDTTYQAWQNAHDGLNTLKNVVEGIKLNSATPFGKTNGTNNIFSYPEEPAFIVVNGVTKINGVDFNYKNGYVTFQTGAPPISAIMKGFHI